MFVPPKKRKEPVTQNDPAPIPTKMQTRSMTAGQRNAGASSGNAEKDSHYHLDLKLPDKKNGESNKTETGLNVAKPGPTQREKAEAAYEAFEERKKNNFVKTAASKSRPVEEAMRDFAIASKTLGTYM